MYIILISIRSTIRKKNLINQDFILAFYNQNFSQRRRMYIQFLKNKQKIYKLYGTQLRRVVAKLFNTQHVNNVKNKLNKYNKKRKKDR